MFEKYRYQRDYRKKLRAEKRRLREYEKDILWEYKYDQREESLNRIKKFISNPFAGKKLNPDQKLRKGMRIQARLERKEQQKEWIQKFRQHPFKTLFQYEKDESIKQMEQWRKADKKVAFRNRIRNQQFTLKEIFRSKELKRSFTLTILQSTTFFILSFLLLYVLYQAITILTAYSFHIPTIWYYYRVKFPLFTGSHLYSRAALISIFGSGPLLCLGLAFLFLKLFFSRKTRNQNLKLFYLWGFINGVNFFFGSYLTGFITRTEFIYVSEWIFMSSMFDVEEIFFAIISITILLLIGRLVTPLFILSAGSEKIIAPKFKLIFILNQVFLPWLIGVMVFLVITTPEHYLPFTIKTLVPIFILLPSLFTYNSIRNENIGIKGVVRKNYFKWSIIIVVIAILFFYRVLLNFGLRLF